MKISQLIKKLQEAQGRYGDIEATIDGNEILDFGVFHKNNTSELQALISATEAE